MLRWLMAKLKNDLPRNFNSLNKHPLNLTISIPPSVNHCFINTRYGGKKLSKAAEKWMYDTRANIYAQMEDQGFVFDNPDVWYVVEMYFYFPDLRIRDSHNTLKVLFDAMQGTFFHNDYFILPRVIFCKLDRKNPRLEMVIYPQPKEELEG